MVGTSSSSWPRSGCPHFYSPRFYAGSTACERRPLRSHDRSEHEKARARGEPCAEIGRRHESSLGRPAGRSPGALPRRKSATGHPSRLTEKRWRSKVSGTAEPIQGIRLREGNVKRRDLMRAAAVTSGGALVGLDALWPSSYAAPSADTAPNKSGTWKPMIGNGRWFRSTRCCWVMARC